MSGPFGSSQWMYSSASGFYSHTIDQSLRFEDGDNPYLSKTFSSSGGTIFTFSCWVKFSNSTNSKVLLQGYSNSTNYTQIPIYSSGTTGQIGVYSTVGGSVKLFAYTTGHFVDPTAWYNVVVKFNGTSGSEEFKVYINGENQDITTSTALTAHQSFIGNNNAHYIGNNFNQSSDMDGYMAEVNFIDGTALDADSFGETKAGIWIPKDTSGLTFGTNGFRLKFQDSSALGDDTSGNGNDFTASGLAATDVVLDSPTNNFANFNGVSGRNFYGTAGAFSQGNLHMSANNSSSSHIGADSTIGVSSGKWYWEIRSGSNGSSFYPGIGIRSPDGGGNIVHYRTQTQAYINGSPSGQTISTYTSGDIIGVALDLDSGTNTLQFYKNGSANGTTFSLTSGHEWLSLTGNRYNSSTSGNFGADSSFFGNETAQGNADDNGIGDFYYSPPSGFLALCTANLPDPAIDPAQDEEPADHFNTVLYTGTGSAPLAITGVGFQPDWIWLKRRSDASNHHLFDSVRGTDKFLQSSTTDVEQTGSNNIDSFDSDGFTLNATSATNPAENNLNSTYVAWNWLAGGSAVSNTDGSITSSVSANTKAGFSIVNFQGTGSVITVGHGLSSTPDFIILKSRDISSSQWGTYHSSLGATKSTYLNSTNQAATNSVFFNNTEPTDSVFTIGTWSDMNTSSKDTIAYCFHSVDGYSKVGSYTGNGSSDGRFVHTGFRPAFVLIKITSGTTSSWYIYDSARNTFNPANFFLRPDLADAELTGTPIDIVSNGFKIRSSSSGVNYSAANYIYLAFAEQPAKYSNAR